MAPDTLPSQLEIVSMGQTYFENSFHFHLSFNVLGVNRGPTDNQSMNSEV